MKTSVFVLGSFMYSYFAIHIRSYELRVSQKEIGQRK